jgi:DNA-binding response OmpR family regulator
MRRGKPQILVADDEAKYLHVLKAILEASGYLVLTASDGQEALEIAAAEEPALILLDVRMPKMDGLEVCRRVRDFSLAPIIMLTALAEKNHIVSGLEAGADDYVTKPFSHHELLARVKAALRRAEYTGVASAEAVFQRGMLQIDFARRRVFVDGSEVRLTSTEYRMLCELAHASGRVVSSSQLLDRIWGPAYVGEEQLVPRVIYRLRQKIEPEPSRPVYVQTYPGLGYMLAEQV